jgi:hypothetical protein
LDDVGTILAGGSPRSSAPRSIHIQADHDHCPSLVMDAIARGVISTTEHDGMRYVCQADLRRWCEAGGTPWKVPHHPGEGDASRTVQIIGLPNQFLIRRRVRGTPTRWIVANRQHC